ncbi:MAG: cytidylyltransferase domain-containing protein [Thermoguttaceae bacterium]
MRVVAIIQARMGSTRLPGKVLEDLGGRTMLSRVVRRTRRSTALGEVVVATSTSVQDDPIVAECRRLGVECFRGSEADVLDRYFGAAEAYRAETVVRVTSDCPLIDWGVIDRVVGAFQQRQPDYASNTLVRTYPRGLDTEVMTLEALARAWCEAREPYQRVHVTPYLYQHPELFRLLPVTGEQDASEGRWTVDTPEDLEFVRAVYERFGETDRFSWRDAWTLVAREPELAKINARVEHKRLEDESLRLPAPQEARQRLAG